MDRFQQPLQPIQWPQDTLVPPPGYGQMPKIDTVNALNVGKEFYVYPFSFSNVSQGQTQQEYIQTEKDGDFWLNMIYVLAIDHGTLTYTERLGRLAILDTITQYQLFNPYAYIMALKNPEKKSTNCGRNQDTMQPTAYQRGTVIQVTLSYPAQTGTVVGQDVYGALIGWKEYANASQ